MALTVATPSCGGQSEGGGGGTGAASSAGSGTGSSAGADSGSDVGVEAASCADPDPKRPEGPSCPAGFSLYADTRCELTPGGGTNCWECGGSGKCFEPCTTDADCGDPCFSRCEVFQACGGGDFCHDGYSYCVRLGEDAGC